MVTGYKSMISCLNIYPLSCQPEDIAAAHKKTDKPSPDDVAEDEEGEGTEEGDEDVGASGDASGSAKKKKSSKAQLEENTEVCWISQYSFIPFLSLLIFLMLVGITVDRWPKGSELGAEKKVFQQEQLFGHTFDYRLEDFLMKDLLKFYWRL